MAQLDLDTATLAAAAADVRAAADALGWYGLPCTAVLTGDPALDGAIERQASAWASTHRALETELGTLAVALRQAVEVFDAAEQQSADRVAALVAPAPPAQAHGSGPLTSTAR